MAKVTSTVIVHRPDRVLYYLPEITEEVNRYIAEGVCPELLTEYQYAYGTYDEAGFFFLPPSLQKQTGKTCVVGIEYRKDDPTLELPELLPFVELPACDVIIQDITYEQQLDEALLKEIVAFGHDNRNDRSADYSFLLREIVV